MTMRRRMILASEEFVSVLEEFIIRDNYARQMINKKVPDKKFFSSFSEATAALAPEIRRLLR